MSNFIVAVDIDVINRVTRESSLEIVELFKDSILAKEIERIAEMVSSNIRSNLTEYYQGVEVIDRATVSMTLDEALSGKLEEVLGIKPTSEEIA